MQFSGSPFLTAASCKISVITILELIASLPPLRIIALPAFNASPVLSAVTLGLDSYIIPITPNGTLINPISMPFGLLHIEMTSFIGSGRAAISLNPSAIL